MLIKQREQEIAEIEDLMAKQRAAQAKLNDDARTEQDTKAIEDRYAKLQALLAQPFELGSTSSGAKFVAEWEGYFNKLKIDIADLKAQSRSGMADGLARSVYGDLTTGLLNDIQQLNLNLITNTQQRAQAEIDIERNKVNTILQINGASARQIEQVQGLLNQKVELLQQNISAQTPMNRLLASWQDTTGQMSQLSANWLNSSAEMLTTFATTGKLKFKDFAKSIVKDLIAIVIKALLLRVILSSMGFGSATMFGSVGGMGAGSGSIPNMAGAMTAYAKNGGIIDHKGMRKSFNTYANGGVASRPQLAVFGEGDDPEAFVPLPDGRTIPVTLTGKTQQQTMDAPAANQPINVQVNVTSSAPVTGADATTRFDGSTYVLDIVMRGVGRPGAFRDTLKSGLGI